MSRPVQCVILAGGLGTRMWPEARQVPKTLLDVAGRPFAEWQLRWLADSGVTDVVYSLGYLGDLVEDHLGDGSRFGLRVSYVHEGSELRGTAGALRLAIARDAVEERFLVLYGDSWLQVDPAAVFDAARESGLPTLMTVFANEGRWDASNVVYSDGRVVRYEKGLQPPPADMRWIDYGLSVLDRDLLRDAVPQGASADLAPILGAWAQQGLLAGYPVHERFYEIGSPTGREELSRLLGAQDADGP